MMKELLIVMRPHQWAKNLFIFFPLFFSQQITNTRLLLINICAFAAFSLIASSVYIFNDYHDIEDDRRHETKKNRPLASGRMSKKTAILCITIILSIGLTASYLIELSMLYLVLFYLILNATYSIKLKHIPILDIAIIAVGFVLRIFVGGAISGVKIYMWIIIMTFLLALFLALAKRRDDVLIFLNKNTKVRQAVDGYNLAFIDSAMITMAAVIIVAYIMYTVSADIVSKFSSDKLYLTTFFVVLGILRFMQITFVENKSGSPTEILMKDRFIQICVAGWIMSLSILIYHLG